MEHTEELFAKVGRMNSAATFQALAAMEAKILELQGKMTAQQNTIGMLVNKVQVMETQANIAKAMARGNGPSA